MREKQVAASPTPTNFANKRKLKMAEVLGIILLLISLTAPIHSKDFEFSKDHTAVRFTPRVSRHDADVPDAYNETESMEMIKVISKRFRRIEIHKFSSKDPTWREHSVAKIPKAAAQFNKYQQINPDDSPPLQVIMEYGIVSNLISSFETVRSVADDANRLYPKTVQTLVLDVSDKYNNMPYDMGVIGGHLARSAQSLKGSPIEYMLGAKFDHPLCNSSSLFQLLPYLDIIMFTFIPTAKELGAGPSSYITQVIGPFTACKHKVTEMNPAVQVGLVTGWADDVGGRNSSELVSFWELVDSWAVASNTSVVFMEAFDNPSGVFSNYKTSGWWRLIESSEYASGMDYLFQEKALLIGSHDEEGNSNETTGDTDWPFSYFPKHPNSSFKEVQQLVLGYSPHPFTQLAGADEYNETYVVQTCLQRISTEFRRIFFALEPLDDSDSIMHTLPAEVAKYNNHCKASQSCDFLQLSIVSSDRSSRAIFKETLTELGWSQRLADDANLIHPGTVTTLLVDESSIPHLLKFRDKIGGIRRDMYKVGLLLRAEHCGSSRVAINPELTSLLSHVDSIMFSKEPSNDELMEGVERHIGGYLRHFRFCKEKIRKLSSKVDVGFMVDWPDTKPDGRRNIGDQVLFWGKIKRWAETTNTTVFIQEAFNSPNNIISSRDTRGWWQDVGVACGNNASSHPSYLTFQDKLTAYLREKACNENSSTAEAFTGESADFLIEAKQISYVTIAVIVVAVGVILIGFTGCGGVALLHRKIVGGRNNSYGFLTREQIEEFLNGGNATLASSCGISDIPAYNVELECKKQEFTIDYGKLLGKGEFGAVYRAKLRKKCGEELAVAAKTVKPPLAPTTLLGMLSEIRVLGYLGKHENIVSILGAYTAELYKGKLHTFMEICTLGSLEAYLRKITGPVATPSVLLQGRGQYVSFNGHRTSECTATNISSLNSWKIFPGDELVRWSYEICCGMEYLASKRVVHADLATRNVLLTESKTAKVSDFGLSRRMYTYERYVEKQEELLPWRWMPPESLRHLKFNEKTDVWSFGVTLWETFSYAEVPYGGLLWSADFVNRLESGLQLTKPHHDHNDLYAVMVQCWNVDASQRPTFSQLKFLLEVCFAGCDNIGNTIV